MKQHWKYAKNSRLPACACVIEMFLAIASHVGMDSFHLAHIFPSGSRNNHLGSRSSEGSVNRSYVCLILEVREQESKLGNKAKELPCVRS